MGKRDEANVVYLYLLCLGCWLALYAEAFNQEGDSEYRKGEYNYAIVCYTEGINEKCEKCENKNIIAKLFTNRAAAHLKLGKNLFLLFVPCSLILFLLHWRHTCLQSFKKNLYLAGNYHKALSDAEAARKLQPSCMKTIEKGIV